MRRETQHPHPLIDGSEHILFGLLLSVTIARVSMIVGPGWGLRLNAKVVHSDRFCIYISVTVSQRKRIKTTGTKTFKSKHQKRFGV
jgi:hypothetical protein